MNSENDDSFPAPGEQRRPPGEQSCERIRAFVAVTTSVDLHRECNRLAVEGHELGMRWVRPESLHLTLRFWADLQADAVPDVCEGLRRAADAWTPFITRVRGLGCFPNADRPRVLWMGLEDPEHQLLQLRRRIDVALATVGLPAEEKPFHPHLTVARVRRAPGRARVAAFLDGHKNEAFGHVAVSHFNLMRSDLSAKGALHTCLHSFPLQGDRLGARSASGALGKGG